MFKKFTQNLLVRCCCCLIVAYKIFWMLIYFHELVPAAACSLSSLIQLEKLVQTPIMLTRIKN